VSHAQFAMWLIEHRTMRVTWRLGVGSGDDSGYVGK